MTESGMIIKALVPWFGAKRILAPRIVELLGPHRTYWEPCGGSLAVLLAKPPCRMETVNDLHEDLINLARVIQDRAQCLALYRRLHRVLCHEAIFDQAREQVYQVPFEPGVDRAYWYFLQSWVGRNGTAGTRDHNQHYARRFTGGGGATAVRLMRAVDSIPAWRRRLRRVCILHMDAFAMIERIADEPDAVMYLDPPYILEKSSHGRDRYRHDFTEAEHDRLAELLHRFRQARVVLGYYDHPRVHELYKGWYCKRPLVEKHSTHSVRRGSRGSIKAPEILLVNQPVEPPEKGLFHAG